MGTGIQRMLSGDNSTFQTLLNSSTVKSNDASQSAGNIDKDKFFASFDGLHRKIQTEFKSKT
jgi:1-phosphatidylinositol-4-phosphate 5-kinase